MVKLTDRIIGSVFRSIYEMKILSENVLQSLVSCVFLLYLLDAEQGSGKVLSGQNNNDSWRGRPVTQTTFPWLAWLAKLFGNFNFGFSENWEKHHSLFHKNFPHNQQNLLGKISEFGSISKVFSLSFPNIFEFGWKTQFNDPNDFPGKFSDNLFSFFHRIWI